MVGVDDKWEKYNAAHLEIFKVNFQVEHHDAIESRSCSRWVALVEHEMASRIFVSSAGR